MKKSIPLAGALLACAPLLPAWSQVVDEVVITASPITGDIIDQSQSVAQLSVGDLIASGGFGLGDALKEVPGVTSSGFAPGAARPVIRGFDAARVRVTENGLGSHDVSDVSADHGVPIDPLSSIEVEVLRGAGTLRYGSQAIGGVVNAINNRIPFDLGQGTAVEVLSGLSSNAAERMIGGLIDHRAGNFAFHADGIIRGADSFDTPDGKQGNTYAFGRGIALGGAYAGAANAAGLTYNQYYSHYGIPSEPGGEVAHIDLEQKNYGTAARMADPLPGIAILSARGGYSDYTHDEIVAGEGVLATFNNDEWEGRIEALHEGFGPVETGAAGLQASKREFEALGEGADYLLPSRTDSIAVYLFERFRLGDSLTLEAAARAERVEIDGATGAGGPVSRGFSPASLALGAVFRATPQWSLALNLSQTARAPAVGELFAQGPHEASATFEIGDPAIGQERARSLEASLRYEGTDGARLTLTGFHSAFEGFITGLLTGNSYDEDGNFFPGDSEEFAELLYIQKDAAFAGFEAEAHLPLWNAGNGMIGIDAQADYVRAEFDSGGNVPRIPPPRYGGSLFYEAPGMELTLGVLRADSQTRTGANETPTASYTMIDASATFRLLDGPQGALDVYLAGANLADARARNHVSFTKDHVMLPGRNFRILLRYVR